MGRPVRLEPIFDNIPLELKEKPQWVLFRVEETWKADGNSNYEKIPLQPKKNQGKWVNAMPNLDTTWSSFDEVVQFYIANTLLDDDIKGIGFVLSKNRDPKHPKRRVDEFSGVDLDECRDPDTGKIQDWAMEIVRKLNSYTEVSPSGTGLRIIVRAILPGSGINKQKVELLNYGSIEIYDNGRFLTITGHHLNGTPSTIESRQSVMDELYWWASNLSNRKGKKATQEDALSNDAIRYCANSISYGHKTGLTDDQVIEKASKAKNGYKFLKLMDGDISDHNNDDSVADAALCQILAFFVGHDAAQIDRIFRTSKLFRAKWDERRGDSTYGVKTIMEALSKQEVFYRNVKSRN